MRALQSVIGRQDRANERAAVGGGFAVLRLQFEGAGGRAAPQGTTGGIAVGGRLPAHLHMDQRIDLPGPHRLHVGGQRRDTRRREVLTRDDRALNVRCGN